MGFPLDGFVLRPPRIAPSNAITTDEVVNGVSQDFKPPSPLIFDASQAPELVNLAADQYRTAVLLRPEDGQTEYLIWAANTADVSVVPNVETTNGTLEPLSGELSVENTDLESPFASPVLGDGTSRFVVRDNAHASVASITEFAIRRGDNGVDVPVAPLSMTFNSVTGIVEIIPGGVLTDLGGGFSLLRGDRIVDLRYTLAPVRFWWTKNDRYQTRFQWNGRTQRWEPLKGTAPRNLGPLLADGSYVLNPVPQIPVGSYLPGSSVNVDQQSMVRIGTRPDAASTPIAEPPTVDGFGGILVVLDETLDEGYDFSSTPTAAGVMGSGSGRIEWNPDFLLEFAGQTVFYTYRDFLRDNSPEPLGRLEDAGQDPLFLTPIPGPTDYPFIRVGNRSPLEAIVVATESLLSAATILPGQVGVARSTGRLKFNSLDVTKADPGAANFDQKYLGAEVFYDGVSLTQRPLALRAPVRLVDSNGAPTTVARNRDLFVPLADPQTVPGTSGVQHIPDGSGTLPNPAIDPGIRYNESGLVREVRGEWDLVLFGEKGRFLSVRVVDDPDDIPRFRFRIPQGRAYLDLNAGATGSPVVLGRDDIKRFDGQGLWFLQTAVQPASWAAEARVYSRVRDEFALVGTETFKFAIGMEIYLWDAAQDHGGVQTSVGGTFTAEEIAESLNAVITGQGSAVAENGWVVLQTDVIVNGQHSGEIEIGWGPGTSKDLSGAAALGFLPGWQVQVSNPPAPTDRRFLPDTGSHLGVFRSPLNLSGRDGKISDVRHVGQVSDIVLTERVQQSPVMLLDKVPLEDLPGYDDGVFFRLQTGLASRNLRNFQQVLHQFGQGKFTWADERAHFASVALPTTELSLGAAGVVPDSLRLPGKGLNVSIDGGVGVLQELDTDYRLSLNGLPGVASLITRVGERVALGARGVFTAGSTQFSDVSPDVDFTGVGKGFQLKIVTGPDEVLGTYVVTEDATHPKQLNVTPPFPEAGITVSWELYAGVDDQPDPGIVADAHYVQFNHLKEEPFKIRQLADLGDVPANAAAQHASRLHANLSRAIESKRPISLRFGQPHASPTAELRKLTQTFLGEIRNSSLVVPNPGGERFTYGDFSIRVGTKLFTFADGNLVKVGALTVPLMGDIIQVHEPSGILHFGDEVLSSLQRAEVYFVEEFSTPGSAILPQGVAEYRVSDGALNLSAEDMDEYGGTKVYLVQQMITEHGQDVTLSPLQGSILFNVPLDENVIVEVEYFMAKVGSGNLFLNEDGLPVKIIEVVPLFVDQEEATFLPSAPGSVPDGFGRRLAFNPTGRTVRPDIEPTIYVGNTLANVGGASSPEVGVVFEDDQLVLQEPVPLNTPVTITYAVAESFGGEQAYTVSTPPVYRPPFRIPANSDSFEVEGDRTGDLVAGKLLRVGATPFYLMGAVYNAATDSTTVSIFPPTQAEAGSLAPGHDVLSLISDRPLASLTGIWRIVSNSFEPVNRGFTEIVFRGDVTQQAIPGHVLEIGGHPFVVAGSRLSEDGAKTTVELTSPASQGFSTQDGVRVTVRPVYQPAPTNFLGLGPVSREDAVEAILFGETDASGNLLPGRTLRLSTEYTLDLETGAVDFLAPQQGPLRSGQMLYLRHTRLRVLAPFVQDEVVVSPRYLTRYVHATAPSEENGLLGHTLRASYTFANPDAWFYHTAPLLDFLAEVGSEIATNVTALLPSRGAVVAVPPAVRNAEQGNLGLKAQIVDLENKDRAARTFIEFYNNVVLAFEQIAETISGNIVGDRDGKFRFFIGRGKDIPPPGYEDGIFGTLNQRNVFSELFFAYNRQLIHLRRDPLVEPSAAELQGNQIVGPFIDPDRLSDLAQEQRDAIRNDVDDLVLVRRTRKRLRLRPLRLEAFGRYARMGEPSRFSRLFPEQADAFTLTDPGIGADLESDPVDPGVYAFRKKVQRLSFKGGLQLPKRASTFRKSIGDIGNPVLGSIEGITGISVTHRLPRARVVAFSETGFPELDPSFVANPRPAVIAVVLPLHQIPMRADGLPDVAQLIANGGVLPDLTTGDPEIFTPPFEAFDRGERKFPQISIGRPTGEVLDVVTASSVSLPLGLVAFTIPKKVFVGEVLQGCILTFVSDDGDPITNAASLLEAGEEPTEASPLEIHRGDTIFITPPDVDLEAADPPDNEEKAAQAEGLPSYRVGFDVRVDDGEYIDISLPSRRDPSLFPLQEVFGQKPPKPMSYLEADVKFRNQLVEPLAIPALTGGFENDSGDYTLPYLYARNTELDRLGEAASAFKVLMATDSPVPGAVYPDEILARDGSVLGALVGNDQPASLLTSVDATPVATSGGYVAGSGVGDVAPFDLLLIETPQGALPASAQGILNIGAVEGGNQGSRIHPARFVTPTSQGSRIRYEFLSMMSFVHQVPDAFAPGMVVSVAGATTTLDATSISAGFLVFNDGSLLTVGGLNGVIDPGGAFAYPANGNLIRINIWTADDGVNPVTFVGSIEIRMNGAAPPEAEALFSGLGPQVITVQPQFAQRTLTLDTAAPFVTIGAGPNDIPEDPANPGFSRPLWFTIDVDTTAAEGASLTGFIGEDRLTFHEAIDMRSVLERDTPPIDGQPVHGRLAVEFVSGRAGQDSITVNNPASVNAGAPFTFLDRRDSFPRIGSFTAGSGAIRVMGFEGHGNAPISSTDDVVFSAIPSSAQDEDGVIAEGTGTAAAAAFDPDLDHRLHVLTDANVVGSLHNVEPGDVLVVTGSDEIANRASSKAGTYLVRHAVQPDPGQPFATFDFQTGTSPVNTGAGFLQVQFPTFEALDTLNERITLSSARLEDGTDAWPLLGRLYFFPTGDIADTISVAYSSVDYATGVFIYDPGSVQDASGGILPPSALEDLPLGILVSGFFATEVRPDRAGKGLPRNLVGLRTAAAFGVTEVAFQNPALGGVPVTLTFGGGEVTEGGFPGADEVRVTDHTPVSNTSFVNDPLQVVYPSVPAQLLFGLSNANWTTVHNGVATAVDALFPGDEILVEFQAQAGVFLEPSFPRPVLDLATGSPKVVDATHSLGPAEIGFRNAADFGAVEPEVVSFEVRRIRRFHKPLTDAAVALQPLRYAYETRRGLILMYGPQPLPPLGVPWPYVIQSVAQGTQLGGFLDENVNVNPGDMFRLLDADGNLLEEVEIAAVVDDSRLALAAPGITTGPVVGLSYEIYLRRVPVPHEQSNAQLLDLITSEVLLEREANYTSQDGGYVPIESSPFDPRKLKDTSSVNFAGEGIQPGDILLIDAAGNIHGPGGVPTTGQERGFRPFGDRSVPNRTVASPGQEVPFIPSGPSELDDNRGFYRVVEVGESEIVVSSQMEFSGPDGSEFVTFGDEAEYAVYPTVSGSLAPFADPPGGPGVEGQNDLRPTAFAGESGSPVNSYRGNAFSIAPFSYKVFRPSPLFSQEAIDLVLTMRERAMSFQDSFQVFFGAMKSGTYFVFQRDTHLSDLGNPLIPDEGLGVMSNALILGVAGLTQISPFANTTDALSVLDRRFWALDLRLDSESPSVGDPTYSTFESVDGNPNAPLGDGRPVLPDLITEILDNNDQFRPLRLSWLNYRVNREDGVLFTIDITRRRLPRQRQRAIDNLRQARSMEDAS